MQSTLSWPTSTIFPKSTMCGFCNRFHKWSATQKGATYQQILEDETLRRCSFYRQVYEDAEQKEFDHEGFVVSDGEEFYGTQKEMRHINKVDVAAMLEKVDEEEDSLVENYRFRRLKKIAASEDKIDYDELLYAQERNALRQDATMLRDEISKTRTGLIISEASENMGPIVELRCTDEEYDQETGEIVPIDVRVLGDNWVSYTTREEIVLNDENFEEEVNRRCKNIKIYDPNSVQIFEMTVNNNTFFDTEKQLDELLKQAEMDWSINYGSPDEFEMDCD